ncbi:hypothetical protein LCGC14_2135790, partial [marine sediment metagenome]
GIDRILDPGEAVVLVADTDAFALRYGDSAGVNGPIPVAGSYTGQLNNGGERITLAERFGATIVDFTYDNSGAWPGRADDTGSSLELIDPAGDYNDSENWRPSTEYGGSPGRQGVGPMTSVVVNEVASRTTSPDTDAIELFNPTETEIDVGGWYLSDSAGTLKKFRIPPGTILQPGGYVYYTEDDFNPSGGVDPLLHPNDFALNGPHGDDVWLTEATPSGKLIAFADHIEVPPADVGETIGRWPNGEGNFHRMSGDTIGAENVGPRLGSVIISELHYNPGDALDADDFEFVEIYNSNREPVDLTDWRLRKGVGFDFDPGTMIGPNSTLVVISFNPHKIENADRLAAFRGAHSIDPSVPLVGGYSGKLDNGGERVQLQSPGDEPADEPGYIPRLVEDDVRFDDVDPWPTEPDGTGSSLTRIASDTWGTDPASWTAATPTPGTADMAAMSEVVGRHVFYNNSHFDGNDPAAAAADDLAIAVDKRALLPGQTATWANYTSYSLGINGLMIDLMNPTDADGLSTADFAFAVGNNNTPSTWTEATAVLPIEVRKGAGTNGSDRVTIRWGDNAIENTWLQVTVKAGGHTGLIEDDIFYIGSAIGESGNHASNTIVNATDEIAARNFQHGPFNQAAVDDPYDYDRDRLVNGTDQIIARGNQTNPLTML